MKKRHVHLAEAYTDESGHTGLHLFDPVQPWFWTGTLVSPVSIQERGDATLRALCASVGEDILHASQLGLRRIEPLAPRLMELLERLEAQFVLTTIEKRHVASTKLADTVLDSTMNKAVSLLHYGFKGLRLLLAHTIVELISPEDQEEFWEVYASADPEGFSRILRRLLVRFRAIAGVNPRLLELVCDALAWGADHPHELLEFQRSEGDAPNLIAVSLLMQGLHDSLSGTGLKVGRFVHDEQQQFGRFIKEWYQIGRNFTMPSQAATFMTDIRAIDTYRCEIEILPSRGVVGLQLIDICFVALQAVYRRRDEGLSSLCSLS